MSSESHTESPPELTLGCLVQIPEQILDQNREQNSTLGSLDQIPEQIRDQNREQNSPLGSLDQIPEQIREQLSRLQSAVEIQFGHPSTLRT